MVAGNIDKGNGRKTLGVAQEDPLWQETHDQSNLCCDIIGGIFSKPCVQGPSYVQLESVRSAQVVDVAADEG